MTDPLANTPIVDASGEPIPSSGDGPTDCAPLPPPPAPLLSGEARAPDGGVQVTVPQGPTGHTAPALRQAQHTGRSEPAQAAPAEPPASPEAG